MKNTDPHTNHLTNCHKDIYGNDAEVLDLLVRMRNGERDAVGRFIEIYGSKVRRRIRGKLGARTRRIFDSQEILSTVGRRLDDFVRHNKLSAMTEGQFWALIHKMTSNAVASKARTVRRTEIREAACSAPIWSDGLSESDATTMQELEVVLDALTDRCDREIFTLSFSGKSSKVIGEAVGLAAGAVRKRLERVRRKLAARFGYHN